MKIYVPFTKIYPETIECLAPYNYSPVKMVDDDDYFYYFKQRWREGESFINCEHDTIFHGGAIEELINCPRDWCAFGATPSKKAVYELSDTEGGIRFVGLLEVESFIPTLALTKFESSFIERYQDVWEENELCGPWLNIPCWKLCDTILYDKMHANGIDCHQHWPNVINGKHT